MKISPRLLIGLALVWCLAGTTIIFARSSRPSPEKLAAFLKSDKVQNMAQAPEVERLAVIDRVAAQLNRLDFEQRRELRTDPAIRAFFEELTPAERSYFLEKTLPEGFRQMINALNNMEPERRKRIVQRALEDVRKMDSEGNHLHLNEEEVKKFISQGLGTFYEEASVEVKLEFASVIEELQRNLQRLR